MNRKKLIKNNPNVARDIKLLEDTLKLLSELKEMGIQEDGYRIASSMFPINVSDYAL